MLHEMSENGWFAWSNEFRKFLFLPEKRRDRTGLLESLQAYAVKSGSLLIAARNVATSICE
jgi:hypothetical protein